MVIYMAPPFFWELQCSLESTAWQLRQWTEWRSRLWPRAWRGRLRQGGRRPTWWPCCWWRWWLSYIQICIYKYKYKYKLKDNLYKLNRKFVLYIEFYMYIYIYTTCAETIFILHVVLEANSRWSWFNVWFRVASSADRRGSLGSILIRVKNMWLYKDIFFWCVFKGVI